MRYINYVNYIFVLNITIISSWNDLIEYIIVFWVEEELPEYKRNNVI